MAKICVEIDTFMEFREREKGSIKIKINPSKWIQTMELGMDIFRIIIISGIDVSLLLCVIIRTHT